MYRIEPPNEESLLSFCLSSVRGGDLSDSSECDFLEFDSVRSRSTASRSLITGLEFNSFMGSPRRSIFASKDQNLNDSTHMEEFVDLASSLHEEFESIKLRRPDQDESEDPLDGSKEELLRKLEVQETLGYYIFENLSQVVVVIRRQFEQHLDEFEAIQRVFCELYETCGLDRCDVEHSALVPIGENLVVAFLLLHSYSIIPEIIDRFRATRPTDYVDIVPAEHFLMNARESLKLRPNVPLSQVVQTLLQRLQET
ncbi:unnamed protein product [Bursaphelenchus xylophilus]|uniref:(pine wood nematode) hypothetical protein n=1 Tax=Bursaphelenchus xylophilus TaxID=6326 RepID=A0A1I7S620_BURXY|nr:unnamed protein product [Bursaphelenchus xylophilus]CAG9082370.1 unnamed protein product [Bursaphelenchus xylophilus]